MRAVRVYCDIGLIREYPSIEMAAQDLEAPKTGIKRSCERKQVACYGLVFRYADDDEFANGASVGEYIHANDKRRQKRGSHV